MPIDLRVRMAAVAALSAMALLVAGVPVSAVQRSVTMVDDRFRPASITVTVGSSVRWVNRGQSAHTVTSRVNGQFDSSLVQPGNGFSHTFTRAGTYRYYCFLHDGMNGVVTVKAAPRPTARPTARHTSRPQPRPTAHTGGGGGGGGGSRPTQPPSDTAPASEPRSPTPETSIFLVILGGAAVGGLVVGHRRLESVRALRR
jgi:plastocyanin